MKKICSAVNWKKCNRFQNKCWPCLIAAFHTGKLGISISGRKLEGAIFVYIFKRGKEHESWLLFCQFPCTVKITLKWLYSSLLCSNNFPSQIDTVNKIKYFKLSKNPETQQKNTKENTSKRQLKKTEIKAPFS